MKRFPSFLVSFFIFGSFLHGQIVSPSQPLQSSIATWRKATVSLGTKEQENGRTFYKAIGTGIVVAVGKSEDKIFVVTAKNMFFDPSRTPHWHPTELQLRFSDEDSKSVYEDLGTSLQLQDAAGQDLWKSADDGSDVAVIAIKYLHVVKPMARVGMDSFGNTNDMYEGERVIVLGFPGVIGNEYLIRAVSRGGIVSWADLADGFKKPFLVDANIYPGNIGGPVLMEPAGVDRAGKTLAGRSNGLLGLVSKASQQDADLTLTVPGVFQPLRLHLQVPAGSIGVVEPVSEITKLLLRVSPPGTTNRKH